VPFVLASSRNLDLGNLLDMAPAPPRRKVP
jgi:hypothetical protein